MRHPLTLIALSLAAGTAWPAAHAQAAGGCKPLIDALEKAATQDRMAQYDLEREDQPLAGRPIVLRIGRAIYTPGPRGMEKDEGGGEAAMVRAFKASERKGEMRCEAAGAGTFRGRAASKLRFVNPMAGSSMNPWVVWIGDNGLPLYHQIGSLPGGIAWVFGDAVKSPAELH
jgi:hypothetical protein